MKAQNTAVFVPPPISSTLTPSVTNYTDRATTNMQLIPHSNVPTTSPKSGEMFKTKIQTDITSMDLSNASSFGTSNPPRFKPFPAINKPPFQPSSSKVSNIYNGPNIFSSIAQPNLPTIRPNQATNANVGGITSDGGPNSYNFNSADFFDRYYKKGWESPQDVKSESYGRIESNRSESKGRSVSVSRIGFKPFKLPMKPPTHSTGKYSRIQPSTKPNLQQNFNNRSGQSIVINSEIPDFLKYAIPMEQIIPSMSNRRMDMVLPGYSRTKYVNRSPSFYN